MSKKTKHNRKKRLQHKKQTSVFQKNNLRLAWEATKNMDVLLDGDLERKAKAQFKKAILEHVESNSLDQAIDQADVGDYRRSLLNYDALNVLSDMRVEKNGAKHACLWGIPLTAPLTTMFRFSLEGQEMVEQIHSDHTDVACLGVIPYHLACAFSPQAVANIMDSWVNASADRTLLSKLRENLAVYTVANHATLENASEQMGTGMMIVGTLSSEPIPTGDWVRRMQQWKNDKQMPALLGEPKIWGEAVADTLLQQCYFDWGADARSRGILESVLMIDRVELTELPSGDVRAQAMIDKTLFGTSVIDKTCLLWAMDVVNEELKNRGVMFEWKDENLSSTRTSRPPLARPS